MSSESIGEVITLPLLDGATTLDMVRIPAGTFTMGSPISERNRDSDKTKHIVTLTNDIYIWQYEITQAQYEALMESNPAHSYGAGPDHPVYFITWYRAAAFCNLLSESQGLLSVYTKSGDWSIDWNANGFRLPTEAEWE